MTESTSLEKTIDKVKTHLALGLLACALTVGTSIQFAEKIRHDKQHIANMSPEDLIRESTNPDGALSYKAELSSIPEAAQSHAFKIKSTFSDGSEGQFSATYIKSVINADGSEYAVFYTAGHCFPIDKNTIALNFSQPHKEKTKTIAIGQKNLGYAQKPDFASDPQQNDFSVFVVRVNAQTFDKISPITISSNLNYAQPTYSVEFPNMASGETYPQTRDIRPIGKNDDQIIFLTHPSAGGASGAGLFNRAGQLQAILSQSETSGAKETRAVLIPNDQTQEKLIQTAINKITP